MGIAGSVNDGRRSADRIIPELQELAVGDMVELAPGMGLRIVEFDPEWVLVLQMRGNTGNRKLLNATDPLPEKYFSWSWVWFV
jgi:hypothetical protein